MVQTWNKFLDIQFKMVMMIAAFKASFKI